LAKILDDGVVLEFVVNLIRWLVFKYGAYPVDFFSIKTDENIQVFFAQTAIFPRIGKHGFDASVKSSCPLVQEPGNSFAYGSGHEAIQQIGKCKPDEDVKNF
jgi:hypothetical protein